SQAAIHATRTQAALGLRNTAAERSPSRRENKRRPPRKDGTRSSRRTENAPTRPEEFHRRRPCPAARFPVVEAGPYLTARASSTKRSSPLTPLTSKRTIRHVSFVHSILSLSPWRFPLMPTAPSPKAVATTLSVPRAPWGTLMVQGSRESSRVLC